MKPLLTFALHLIPIAGIAQPFVAGESNGLAEISTVLQSSSWNGFLNPAFLGDEETKHAFSYTQQLPYGLKELSTIQLAYAHRFQKNKGFAVQLQQHGFGLIENRQASFAYGMLLTEGFQAGIRLHVINYQQGEAYPSITKVNTEIGMAIQLNKHWLIGSQLMLDRKRNELQQFENQFIKIGAAYLIDNRVSTFGELTFTRNQPLIQLGIKLQLHPNFHLLAGSFLSPNKFTFGASYQLPKNWEFNFNTTWHPVLGYLPSIGILFSGK